MAHIKQAKTEEEIKKLTVTNVKKEYLDLAKSYNKIIEHDYILCPVCGEFISRDNFYADNRFAIGVYPQCKKCILAEVEQRKNKNDKPNETKKSVQAMLQKMDLPYVDSLYESLCKDVADEVNEKNKRSPFLAYLPPIKSLSQYRGKTYANSEFENGYSEDENTTRLNQKTIKNGRKRFGDYPPEDLMFLENEYQDWIERYECNSKAQEAIFERLSFKKWEINKATKSGQPTKDLDHTYQELLKTGNISPKDSKTDAFSSSLTFGQLIEKWEMEEVIPEPSNEFKDVDNIGKFIRINFKGALARALGIDNGYSKEYDDYMAQYTVTKPEVKVSEGSGKGSTIYEQIFGSDGE